MDPRNFPWEMHGFPWTKHGIPWKSEVFPWKSKFHGHCPWKRNLRPAWKVVHGQRK